MKPILKVNDIFCSIQGEGGRAGEASIFIRLSGCNLQCPFCDTEFNSGQEMEVQEIIHEINAYSPCKWIVWTGGEPCLQLTEEIIKMFYLAGYKQAIETNGTLPISKGFDYISVSPKSNLQIVGKVDELRFLFKKGVKVPFINLDTPEATNYYLSPVFDGEENEKLTLNMDNVNACVEYIKCHPQWKLSIQLHKLLKIK